VALLAGTAVAVCAVACGRHGKRMSEAMMRELALDHVEDLMDDIDADDTQRARFEALAGELIDDAIALKKAHKSQERAVLKALESGSPDREAVHAHMDQQFDQLEGFAHRSLDKVFDAYQTLDDDQQRIVLDKLAKHMEKH
jgi:Spy/CpxP family protein refolding chaperone